MAATSDGDLALQPTPCKQNLQSTEISAAVLIKTADPVSPVVPCANLAAIERTKVAYAASVYDAQRAPPVNNRPLYLLNLVLLV